MGDGEFVIITAPGQGKALIAEATARFIEVKSSRFYPAAACQQGYMMAPGHDGQLHQCPLAALSFEVDNQQYDTPPAAGQPTGPRRALGGGL